MKLQYLLEIEQGHFKNGFHDEVLTNAFRGLLKGTGFKAEINVTKIVPDMKISLREKECLKI